ncbi:MAG: hypothetical protein AAFV25_20665 [Bacteroidota bacterium]
MKYVIGFIAGVVFTLGVFVVMQYQEKQQIEPADPIVADDATASSEEEATSIPPDFFQFYTRFHEDSSYQLSHIRFPLQGLPPNVDSLTLVSGQFRWTADNWTVHKPFDTMEGEFQQYFDGFGPDMVVERIQHKSGAYGMQRRFARFEDGWQLIFYAAMNQMK